MSIDKRRDKFMEICKKQCDIYVRKNTDYGNSFEESLDEFGAIAYVVRADDKMRRIKQLINNPAQVKDEQIEDTISDLANYSIMLLMWKEKNK